MIDHRSAPLIPRWAVVVVTFVLVGVMAYVAAEGDYVTVIVLSVVLFFILGADVGAMLRAWRGLPPDPSREPVDTEEAAP